MLPANSDGANAIGCSRLCQQGIRINAVNLGPIATDLMARSADQMGITFDDRLGSNGSDRSGNGNCSSGCVSLL